MMCHAHHAQHWVDDGATSLANLVLLCGHHHRLVHAQATTRRVRRQTFPMTPVTVIRTATRWGFSRGCR